MTKAEKFDITATLILVPMAVLAITMVCFFAFQTTQIMQERNNLHNRSVRIDSAYENSQKVNSQFGGLVLGTQKLAKEGSSSAKNLVKRLMQIGILPDPSKLLKAQIPVKKETGKLPVKP